MIPSYELSPKRSAQDNCLDNYRKRFHRVSRRHHGSKSMMSDTRRKSCITEFEEDLGKAAKNPFQELFAKFCSSSTIHGTYFWIASGSYLVRAAWGLIGTVQDLIKVLMAHCSKCSFIVQKFNFDFPRKLSIF